MVYVIEYASWIPTSRSHAKLIRYGRRV